MRSLWNHVKSRLSNARYEPLLQFIRFGLVGVSNTLIQYAVEQLCYYVVFRDYRFPHLTNAVSRITMLFLNRSTDSEAVLQMVVTCIGFIISVTNAYYWNSRIVFAENGQVTRSLRGYLKTVASYALTGLVLAPIIKYQLTQHAFPFWLASLSTLILTIPLNFLLNKFWAFRRRT